MEEDKILYDMLVGLHDKVDKLAIQVNTLETKGASNKVWLLSVPSVVALVIALKNMLT